MKIKLKNLPKQIDLILKTRRMLANPPKPFASGKTYSRKPKHGKILE